MTHPCVFAATIKKKQWIGITMETLTTRFVINAIINISISIVSISIIAGKMLSHQPCLISLSVCQKARKVENKPPGVFQHGVALKC